ncbi:MAG: response regulator transcription factor [Proteobacteria bacterium]|nr:response regulator transcription factor [Pseudomonadota bacterium]
MHSILLLHGDPHAAGRLADIVRSTSGLQLAGRAHSLAQARTMIEQRTPDLVLATLRLEDGWATRLMDEIRGPGRKGGPLLVVLADSFSDPNLMLGLRHGADGYVVQGRAKEAIVSALRLVLGGGAPMSPEIACQVLAHFEAPGDASAAYNNVATLQLTPDERLMLDHVSAGYLPHEIARQLRLSEAQVTVRVRNVYRKLQYDLRGSLQLIDA